MRRIRCYDPRKGDTPGWSNTITSDDRIIHPMIPDQVTVHWLRVVPDEVDAMQGAVDEANW